MSSPSEADWLMLKRLARYLIGRARVVLTFVYQGNHSLVDAWMDTDYAGCRVTRKSTSGGVIMIGGHSIKSYSSTQKTIALSSAEAELTAAVKCSCETIGITQLAADWGLHMNGNIVDGHR